MAVSAPHAAGGGRWQACAAADAPAADFTKLYNRSRQLASVAQASSGNASGSAASQAAANVPLPAMNRARRAPVKRTGGAEAARPAGSGEASTSAAAALAIGAHANKTEAQLSNMSHLSSRLKILDAYDPSASAGGAVSGAVPRKGAAGAGEKRNKDKADRATTDGVLDPRTMVILFKMLARGLLAQIDGCVSTGKEANVYHASTPPPEGSPESTRGGNVALKIYKTSILVFKDRDRYVSGEFRFRHGYARHNPRKMVRLWAEKEARNLKRLVSASIRAPRPIELRDHVLVMDFLGGQDGWASPRLRDAEEQIDNERGPEGWGDLYREMLVGMRTMYHECRLVHADLSEYNVL